MIVRGVCLSISLALLAASCADQSVTTQHGNLTAVSIVGTGMIETSLHDGATVVGTMHWDLATNRVNATLPDANHEMTLIGRDQSGTRANEVLYKLSTARADQPIAEAQAQAQAQGETTFRLDSPVSVEEGECWDAVIEQGCSRCCSVYGACCLVGSQISCIWEWSVCQICQTCPEDHGYCGDEYCGCGACCGSTCCI